MHNRVVIADDDPTMRSALGEALRTAGYNAEVFCHGGEAEQHLRRYGADLVISDIRMPELGGLELLKQFTQHSFYHDQRVCYRARSGRGHENRRL